MQVAGSYTQQGTLPQIHRKKYREGAEGGSGRLNIMSDPRVCRGSTYAHTPVPPSRLSGSVKPAGTTSSTTVSRGSTRLSGANSRLKKMLQTSTRPVTPPPVDGRVHLSVQTDSYMEELSSRPPESAIATQTEKHLDRPVSPLFVPRLSGESKSTEIGVGDLFDFDREVEPILEVLVGKSLDHALMEVCEEHELKAIRSHREIYEQKRNAAIAVTQRLEAAEVRRVEEKERRVKQERERLIQEQVDKRQHTARTVAKETFAVLRSRVLVQLEQSGFFYDPVQRNIETSLLPWLMQSIMTRVQEQQDALEATDALISEAIAMGVEKVRLAEETIRLREEARLAAEEAERQRIQREKEEAERQRLEAIRLAAEAEAAKIAAEEAKRLKKEQAKAANAKARAKGKGKKKSDDDDEEEEDDQDKASDDAAEDSAKDDDASATGKENEDEESAEDDE